MKKLPANAGYTEYKGSIIPGSGRPLEGGNDNPLQNSCLENPMDRGAWQATSVGLQRIGYELATEHAANVVCAVSWLYMKRR